MAAPLLENPQNHIFVQLAIPTWVDNLNIENVIWNFLWMAKPFGRSTNAFGRSKAFECTRPFRCIVDSHAHNAPYTIEFVSIHYLGHSVGGGAAVDHPLT